MLPVESSVAVVVPHYGKFGQKIQIFQRKKKINRWDASEGNLAFGPKLDIMLQLHYDKAYAMFFARGRLYITSLRVFLIVHCLL